MMTTANCHPHGLRFSHPVPAIASEAASDRNRRPIGFPDGESSLYARGFSIQILSRAVLRDTRVVLARDAMTAPKNRKIPTAFSPVRDPNTGALGEGEFTR